ncbi:uncharacterized protein LOC125463798 [Stegostoma tigrinum]|uniref:uncharacterized protein LOC125463798 n=1 Tax=Stegostoma tigrinum TaxID=3053191 RepID=UPI00202AF659|nr:uncharacterized protein LOC125463798 [Stegostoma tigrinum]
MATQKVSLLHILLFSMISGVKTDGHISPAPFIKRMKNGASFSINCEYSSSQGTIVGTYIRRSFSNPIDLIYVHPKQITKHKSYETRLEYKGDVKNFTVTINNIQESDIGIYYCVFGIRNKTYIKDSIGQETVLLSESNLKDCKTDCADATNCTELLHKDPIMIGVIITAIVAIICALIMILWHARKKCQPEKPRHGRAPNSVYEDMNLVRTQSVRR